MKTPRPWYDDADSISRILETEGLDGFNRIIEAAKKGTAFGRLLILGRFVLHGAGTIFLIRNNPPKLAYPLIPTVVSNYETRPYLNALPAKDVVFPSIPHTTLRCPYCHLGWTLANCHDFKWIEEPFQLTKDQCLVTTLGDMQTLFLKPRSDAIYTLEGSHPVFNKKWIKPDINTVEPDPQSLPPTYVISEGDVLYFKMFTYFHEECHRMYLVRHRTLELEKILSEAGFQTIILQFIRKTDRKGQTEVQWHAHTEIGTLQISEWQENFYSVDTEHCGLRSFPEPPFKNYDNGYWANKIRADFVTLLSDIRAVGMKRM